MAGGALGAAFWDEGAAAGMALPAEWGAALASGIAAQAANLAQTQPMPVRLTYHDLVSSSWGRATRSAAADRGGVVGGERSLSAQESHLRWCRSAAYAPSPEMAAAFSGRDAAGAGKCTRVSPRDS